MVDLVVPGHAPKQSFFVALGILSLFALLAVIITTQKIVKRKMSFRFWKNVHLVSYGTAMLFIIHGLKMDPQLQGPPYRLLDGEKLLCEVCLLLLLSASFLRIKYHYKNLPL